MRHTTKLVKPQNGDGVYNGLEIIRGSSHYATQAKTPLPKLLSRGERRSPLKYIMDVFLLDFEYFIEKKFGLLIRVWISIFSVPKLLVLEVPKSAAI